MSENGGGRPRRSTRYSQQVTSTAAASGGGGSASSSQSSSQISSTPNPYKKPTYLANRSVNNTPDTTTTPTSSGRGRGRGRGRPRGGGGRGRAAARPECVATRVESRRSTGGSTASSAKNKKKRGGYNSHDYHYGSDFESDQAESDPEPHSDSDSASVDVRLDEEIESDADITEITSRYCRLPSPPVPLWMDTEKVVEELELPKSSDDLLLERDLVMKAVAIYEPLRRFHQLVRLSPFRFEDFCAALGSDEQSSLLAEIHIQLLKTILREEDANGTSFGPTEVKDSVQAVLYFVDYLTWPESLQSYFESDPNWVEMYDLISSVEYPFCGPQIRIRVLMWLVDMFLATNSVREALLSEGNIRHEDHCRACNRLGELICCETCPAVYHLGCISPPLKDNEDPPDDWKCPVCIKHRLSGVIDCASELEKAGLLIRHDKLGWDRHGRKYWFLVRRILVESEDGSSVWYYTTPLQVEELLYRLDEDVYEAELVDNIRTWKDEIVRQMEITETITDTIKNHRRTYIEAENAFLKKIHEEREIASKKDLEDRERKEFELLNAKRIEEEKKTKEEEDLKANEEAVRKKIREERLQRRNRNKFVDYDSGDITNLDDHDSREANHLGEDNEETETEIKKEVIDPCDEDETKKESTESNNKKDEEKKVETSSSEMEVSNSQQETQIIPNEEIKVEERDEKSEDIKIESESVKVEPEEVKPSRRKSKALLLDWDTEERMTRLKSTGLYKLGQEGFYKNYVNVYAGDGLSLSKSQHVDEQSRKRQMSHKFSLTTASEFKWIGNHHGFRSSLVGTMRSTLLNLEGAFPITLMHVNWPLLRKAWVTAVSACVNSKDFTKAMVALAACIRPACFNTLWSELLGHVKLIRITAAEKEERKKLEKRDKKEREEEEDRLKSLPQFVHHTIPIKHQVFKQKGEEYRIHGQWGWIWLSKLRRCPPQDCRKMGLLGGPNKHVIQVKNELGKVKTILIDPPVFEKLMAKRSMSHKTPSSSANSTPRKNSDDVAKELKPNVEEKEESKDTSEEQKEAEKMETETVDDKSEGEGGLLTEESKHKSSESESEEIKSDKMVVEKDIVSKSEEPMEVEEINENPITESGSLDKVKKEPLKTQKVESVAVEASVVPTISIVEEEVKTEIKEEAKDEEKPIITSSDDLSKNAVSRPKFKTELVNVSLGIVSANRILYPKIAHRSTVLDNLLTRRTQLQQMEEKELVDTFGIEMLEKAKIQESKEKEEKENKEESVKEEVLDDSFPLAGIYRYKCYSHSCQSAAADFMKGKGKSRVVREYEFKCYSPMCRLKYFVQESERKKEEKIKELEKEKLNKIIKEIQLKRMYTQVDSNAKVYLKKLPDQMKKKRNHVKYPMTSTFKSPVSKEPSILILPDFELKKLARAGGRTFSPSGFAPAPKTGSVAWPYPCGRPFFKTTWQFRAVHANTLAAAALQLRILWASVRWDDIQVKIPNGEGKNQMTTDMEIITSEILNQRVIGRFMERVQYLRKKTTVPIDASPKTMRVKSRDSSEITPSRSGLRKRKRAESPDRTDPVVTEDWVDEDKVELWEIKFYGERLERKAELKPGTPATRTKSGVTLKQPEKYDPSSMEKERPEKSEKIIPLTKNPEVMKEQLETELKMQRAVLLSKRDNHAKTNNNPNKIPTPTASQQLREQQNAAAASHPSNPRSYVANTPGKKIFVSKTGNPGQGMTTPSADPVILNRKPGNAGMGKQQVIVNAGTTPGGGVASPTNPQQAPTQKITVFRTADGKLQVRGLLPGQTVYSTSDGKICLAGTAGIGTTPLRTPGGNIVTAGQQILTSQQPQQQQQTRTIVIPGQPGQLQQSSTPGVIQSAGGGTSQMIVQTTNSPVNTSQVVNQPLINISNPAMRTVMAQQPQQQQQQPQTMQIIQQGGQQMQIITSQQAGILQAMGNAAAQQGQQGQQIIIQQGAGGQQFATIGGQQVFVKKIVKPPLKGGVAGNFVQISGGTTTPGGNIVSTGQQILTSQQPQQQQQQQQQPQTMQIIQQGGQQMQIITSQHAGILQAMGNAATQHQQDVAGGQQFAKIGGQQVLVKKILNTPVKGGVAGNVVQISGGTTTPGGNVVSTGQQILTSQQPQQQQQQQPQTMQIIQQGGQQMQIITSQQAGILQAMVNAAAQQGQQGQQIIIQQGAGGQQFATIGGQQVLVKKILKNPVKGGVAGNVVQISGGTQATQAQLQQLIAQGKNVIRVDQKTGSTVVNAATMQQFQQQLQQQQQQQPQQKIQPQPINVGATTVTRTPGLPISIVSPSKAKMVPTSIMPQQNVVGSPLTSIVSSGGVIRQITPGGVIQTIASAGARLAPSGAALGLGGTTQVVSAVSGPQVVSTVGGTLSQTQHQQIIRVSSPAQMASLLQQGRIISSSTSLGQSVITTSGIQKSQVSIAMQDPHHQHQAPTSIPMQKIVNSPTPSINQLSPAQAQISPGKTPLKNIPNKLVAQVIQTPQGAKVVLQSAKPNDVSDAQWAEITMQLQKQLENTNMITKGSPIKMFLQPQLNASQVPSALPASAVTGQSMTAHLAQNVTSSLVSSPPKMAKITSPSTSQVIGVKSQPPPLPQSPSVRPSSSQSNLKTPPNSANVDAAIAAVASDVDAPVIVPLKHSPKKSPQHQTGVLTKGGNKAKGGMILKNILQKPDQDDVGQQQVFASKSLPQSSSAAVVKKSPPPKRKPPAKKSPQQPKASSLMLLTPVEPSSVPQPIEQDVVISTSEPHEISAVGMTPPHSMDGPRFVLSQDLMNHNVAKEVEIPQTASMTFFAGQKSPKRNQMESSSLQSVSSSSHSIQRAPSTKSGSSRRKSPVKGVLEQQISPNKISMSAMAPQRVIQTLNKHKEFLKKDICKKRSILEKELYMDIHKEINEDLGRNTVNRTNNKQDLSSPQQESHQVKGAQKRKISDSTTKSLIQTPKELEPKQRKRNSSSPAKGLNIGGGVGGPNKKKGKSSNKLYCVCRTPYDSTKFYVGCDICSNWFHGDCVGITEELSQTLEEWTCEACKSQADKLYCLCRQPYDDAQFYICCDSCQDWFHGRCVGILQCEGPSIEEYVCPKCDPDTPLNHANLKELSENNYAEISSMLKGIQAQKNAWPFKAPVDPSEAPNYYKVIKEPMDLQTIEFRVEEKIYNKLRDFVGDITKIFDNCRYYNPPASPFFKSAESLESYFAQKLAILRKQFDKEKNSQ